MPRPIGLVVVALCLASCGDNVALDGVDAALSDAIAADADVSVPTHLVYVQQTQWPGAGRELLLRVDHEGPAEDFSPRFEGRLADGSAIELSASSIELDPGYTALVVRANSTNRADVERGARAFIDARPVGERVAIFRWGATLDQVSDFTADRRRLHRLLPRATASGFGAKMTASAAIEEAADVVERVGGFGGRDMRAVAVLAPGLATTTYDGPATTVFLNDDDVDQAVILGIAALERSRVSLHYSIALCGPAEESTIRLSLADAEGQLLVVVDPALPETATAECALSQIGPGKRIYPEVIEFVFTPAERLIFDSRVDELNEDDFQVSIRLGAGTTPVAASAHLRGQGSVSCQRKSMTVNLSGAGRHLLAGSHTDEFYLISMCLDELYVSQFTANQLMSEYGVFPLRFRYVELVIDGEGRGVYLLLEKTKEQLVLDHSRVRSVMRRRFGFPGGDYLEVKHADGTDAEAIKAGNDIHAPADFLSGESLGDELRERFDLDAYLRFLALMTAYQNGDYVDEVWFYSTDTVTRASSVGDYFGVMGWDNDDLFSPCHYGDLFAFDDPHELLFCAESSLAAAIFSDPYIYGLFVDRLEQTLAELTPERFNTAVDITAAQLLPYFGRPDICAVMTELLLVNPAAVDPEVAVVEIQSRLDFLKTAYGIRRDVLLSRIGAYRLSL